MTHHRGIIPYRFKMIDKSVIIPVIPSLSLAHFDVLVATSSSLRLVAPAAGAAGVGFTPWEAATG